VRASIGTYFVIRKHTSHRRFSWFSSVLRVTLSAKSVVALTAPSQKTAVFTRTIRSNTVRFHDTDFFLTNVLSVLATELDWINFFSTRRHTRSTLKEIIQQDDRYDNRIPRSGESIRNFDGKCKCRFKIPERHSVEKRIEPKSVPRIKKCQVSTHPR
jgi:hypothetical protein